MMNFHYLKDYDEMSRLAQLTFDKSIENIEHPKVILATGNSPLKLYRNLVSSGNNYGHVTFIKLDEWMGMPMNHSSSCEHFLQNEVIIPLEIPKEQYLSINGQAVKPIDECKRIASAIDAFACIDLCILGLGKNGHLGLNEPADELLPFCHVNPLEISSQNHEMLQGSAQKISKGITLGMAEILKAKTILLLVSGKDKNNAFQGMMSEIVTPQLPASFLHLHPDVVVLVDGQCVKS